MNIKQIVLSNGDELVCELLDEDEKDIVIRNAVKMVEFLDRQGERGYSFKSFMLFQDTSENIIMLRQNQVVAAANPIKGLVAQYREAIELAKFTHNDESWDELLNTDSEASNVVKFTTH